MQRASDAGRWRQRLTTDAAENDGAEVGMASHLLSQFPQNEQNDFSSVGQKYGRAVSEFEVVDEDQYPAGGRVG